MHSYEDATLISNRDVDDVMKQSVKSIFEGAICHGGNVKVSGVRLLLEGHPVALQGTL